LYSLTENDPISLEPLAELGYPPFEICSDDSEGKEMKHLFDGQVLGYYLVSRLNFENPMTREPLTRENCVELDKYYKEHKLTKSGMTLSIARAFDMKKRQIAQEERELRREERGENHGAQGKGGNGRGKGKGGGQDDHDNEMDAAVIQQVTQNSRFNI
jgi:hypothetical protein